MFLSSPRLCCLLMTPPNVHLRSSLFRWALCRLVTDTHTHTRRPDDKEGSNKHGDMKSKHKCYTNTQHTNDMDPLLATWRTLKHDHNAKHGGQLAWVDGGYKRNVKNQDISSVACNWACGTHIALKGLVRDVYLEGSIFPCILNIRWLKWKWFQQFRH